MGREGKTQRGRDGGRGRGRASQVPGQGDRVGLVVSTHGVDASGSVGPGTWLMGEEPFKKKPKFTNTKLGLNMDIYIE